MAGIAHVDGYLEMLFQRVAKSHYPSKDLLDRIASFSLSGS